MPRGHPDRVAETADRRVPPAVLFGLAFVAVAAVTLTDRAALGVLLAATLGLAALVAASITTPLRSWEVFAIATGVTCLLFFAGLGLSHNNGRGLVLLMSPGVLVAAMLWTELRRSEYAPPATASLALGSRVLGGGIVGLGIAVFTCVVAVVRVLAAGFGIAAVGRLWLLFGGYIAAGLLVGVLAGVLLPLARWKAGLVALASFAGSMAYFIVMIASDVSELSNEPFGMMQGLGIALIAGGVVGPTVAFGLVLDDWRPQSKGLGKPREQ